MEPTDVCSCPPQEGGYSPRGAREGESKEAANSERRPRRRAVPHARGLATRAAAGKRTLAVSHAAPRSI